MRVFEASLSASLSHSHLSLFYSIEDHNIEQLNCDKLLSALFHFYHAILAEAYFMYKRLKLLLFIPTGYE